MTDIRSAQADGLMDRMPSFTSVARYLENPDLAPILKSLIEQSALPLKSLEQDFAVDSSGFSTSVYHRWFSHKWNKQIKEATWIKAHIICGVQTNIITSAEVNDTMGPDSPEFPGLVNATARNFDISEVSADKAYLSKRNLRIVQQAGGTAYIPFKSNSKAITHHKRDSLWERTFHYLNQHRGEFLEHYNKRSNVETAFHMIKAKFGGAVRTKTPVAQVNEVLVKILRHNVTCLIRAMYELGVEPTFGTKPPRPVEGGLQVLPVHLPHQRQVLLRGSLGTVVETGTAHTQQRTLSHYRQIRVLPVHHLPPPAQAHGPDLSAKKSRSTLSWPIS